MNREVNEVLRLFRSKVKVVNIGLEHFYRELKKQNVEAVHVMWRPKPEIEKDLQEILKKIL